MTREQRISSFVQLGRAMESLSSGAGWSGFGSGMTEVEFLTWEETFSRAAQQNGWFTEKNTLQSFKAWTNLLTEDNLKKWLAPYQIADSFTGKAVGIIGAGNIPLVAFHDVLSVLISGHKAIIRLSSEDEVLIPALLDMLAGWDQRWKDQTELNTGKLTGFDKIIATGSNNTSRYFEYYFREVPHIIRKSRNSVAILDGTETKEELVSLGHDMFDYFGLGCRSITKIYLPEGYEMDLFFKGIFDFSEIVNHNKYANNYDYNKAVWLLNQEDLLDNGFLILRNDKALASPTGSIYFEYYVNPSELKRELDSQSEQIQCIAGHGFLPFGTTQKPDLWEYADGIDTMKFLQD